MPKGLPLFLRVGFGFPGFILRAIATGGLPLPSNVVPPSVPSELETGVEAVAGPGTWIGANSVTGAWFVDGVQVATGYAYTPESDDAALSAFFRETATNATGSDTADSETRTILYNPIVVSGVVEWATLRRASGFVQDDFADPIPGAISGYDFFAPSASQAPIYQEGTGGGPPGALFDGIDDVSEHLTPSNFEFLYGGPSTIMLVLDGAFSANQYFFSQGTASANGHGVAILFLSSGSIRYYLSNGTGNYIYFMNTPVSPAPGQNTFCFAQDLTDLRFYFNGVLAATLPVSGTPAYSSSPSTFNPRFSNTVLEMALTLQDCVFASVKCSAPDILDMHNKLTALT